MIWRGILRVLSTALAVLVLAIAASVLSVHFSGSRLLSVQSGSMSPAISTGDLVVVSSVPDNLAVGDVVTFIQPGSKDVLVTHRVIEIANESITTKGDANYTSDEPIPLANIVGKVSLSIPGGGNASRFIQQPLGLILVIYLPALIILVSEIRRLTKHYKQCQPYIHPSSEPRHIPKMSSSKLIGAKLTIGLTALILIFGAPAWAALSDTATLTGNSISTSPRADKCFGSSSNNVNIANETNQTAQSGDGNLFGNEGSGSVQSGNASNLNSSELSIAIGNCSN